MRSRVLPKSTFKLEPELGHQLYGRCIVGVNVGKKPTLSLGRNKVVDYRHQCFTSDAFAVAGSRDKVGNLGNIIAAVHDGDPSDRGSTSFVDDCPAPTFIPAGIRH